MEQIGRIAREHDDATCAALNAEKKQQLNALLTRIAVALGTQHTIGHTSR